MFALLILHGVVGAAVFPSGPRLGRRAFLVAAIAPAATLLWLATKWSTVLDGETLVEHGAWVPRLGLSADLRLDAFSALMVLLIALIGLLVCVFSTRYYSLTSERVGRNAGLLVLFAGAMLVVVLADNLLLLYTGWELTSIVSYLLIGNEHTKPHARAAALQALLVTSFGGLAMLAGFVVLGQQAGTYSLGAILADPPTGAAVNAGLVLVLVGAFAKSAQYPFHFWLPGAMAAPTPISAYLHSATMVKAGVFLIARFAPAFATTAVWRPVVLTVGLVTMICGGLRALRQTDLKLLLAYGTVSQLGFLVVLFGTGTPASAAAGCLMLLGHALFKAALFMAVGTVDHHMGTRDLRQIPRLGPRWRGFAVATVVSAASMAGLPLLFGFVSKEAGLQSLVDAGIAGGWVVAGVAVGSALTVAYSVRLVWGILGLASPKGGAEHTAPSPQRDAPNPVLVVPVVVLAGLSILFGVAPRLVQDLHDAAAAALDEAFTSSALAVWHGIGAALLLTVAALGAGAVLFLARVPVEEKVLVRGAVVPSGGRTYVRLLRGTNVVASRVTGLVQNGSLPIYAGVTLLTAALLPGVVLLVTTEWPGWPDLVGAWAQVPVVVAILGAAVCAALVRRRFTAALFLGATGYGMAGLFVVQGAPDLALTQVAIETLSTVLFVLVLRRLPDRFERTSTRQRRVARVVISGVVGLTVFLFAIVSRAGRTAEPVSTEMIELSLPEGHGRNVVNVILVDIRGFDTMGEITVLVSAAIGAVALARVGRRRKALEAEFVKRLHFLEEPAGLLFHAVLIGSVYLLFAGHNQPGGGFAGGLVAGAAVSLRYLFGGIAEVRRISRFQPWTILAAGLFVSVATATAPLVIGEPVLTSLSTSLDPPLLGPIYASTTLLFDVGVYMVVIGLVFMLFEAFGEESGDPS